ncbi:MAG: SDR family oxidoreductase [Actinobacteria bacterium]|nr:SDR family oxidoreductase [Actinomycetota bacterium]
MTQPLEGRTALVTGGGRGIGRAVALALAADGADVAITYRRDAGAAAEVAATIAARGRRAAHHAAPMDDRGALTAMVRAVEADLGPVDLLVSNAGIASRGHAVADTDPAELERVLHVHAVGAHDLCRLVLPGMRTRPRGDIVMISSVAARHLAAGGGPYNMGKAALEALAMTLAKEERANGIHVNVVAPGLVDTEMGRRLVKGAAGVDDISSLAPEMPFGRLCTPEDVAGAVLFFVSGAAGYVTGQRLEVDGGGR